MVSLIYFFINIFFRELKPEAKLWKLVKENLSDIHWTRIENRVGQGIPDCYGIKDGISIWVELKVIYNNKIKLSPFQKSWHFTHSLKGGRSFILATTLPHRLLYIFGGSVAPSISSIARCPSPNWQVSMDQDQDPWMQVREVLLHSPLPKPSPQE